MAEGAEAKQNELTRPFDKIYGIEVTGRKRPTNYVETLIHMVKGYVGTGIFALGAGFHFTGILLGPLLLVCACLICLHCQHILARACEKIAAKETVDVLPSYGETVKYTFEDSSSPRIQRMSKIAGATANTFIVVAKYGTSIIYMIFVSTHIKEMVDGHGWVVDYRVWLAILLVPIWIPIFIANLKILMPLSLIANILMWFGIGVIIYYTSQDLVSIKERKLVAEIHQYPKFIGIALFSFMGISFILNIRMEMKHRETFTTPFGILNVSILIVLALYLLVGILSYWKYGECIKGSTFLNLPQRGIIPEMTKGGIAIALAFSYPLHMYIPFEIVFPMFHQKFGPFKYPSLVRNLYKSFWVIVTYMFANIDSRLDAVIGVIGSIAGSTITLVIPASIDIAEKYGRLGIWRIAKDIMLIIFGIIGAIIGAGFSILDIVNHITHAKHTYPEHCNSTT